MLPAASAALTGALLLIIPAEVAPSGPPVCLLCAWADFELSLHKKQIRSIEQAVKLIYNTPELGSHSIKVKAEHMLAVIGEQSLNNFQLNLELIFKNPLASEESTVGRLLKLNPELVFSGWWDKMRRSTTEARSLITGRSWQLWYLTVRRTFSSTSLRRENVSSLPAET